MIRTVREMKISLKEDITFQKAKVNRRVRYAGSFPFRIVVVYDFLRLDKEDRYRFFDFERRLLDRMEGVLSGFFGEKVSLPVEVEFLGKSLEHGK